MCLRVRIGVRLSFRAERKESARAFNEIILYTRKSNAQQFLIRNNTHDTVHMENRKRETTCMYVLYLA